MNRNPLHDAIWAGQPYVGKISEHWRESLSLGWDAKFTILLPPCLNMKRSWYPHSWSQKAFHTKGSKAKIVIYCFRTNYSETHLVSWNSTHLLSPSVNGQEFGWSLAGGLYLRVSLKAAVKVSVRSVVSCEGFHGLRSASKLTCGLLYWEP